LVAVIVAFVVGVAAFVCGVRLQPQAKIVETRVLSEAHALYDAGLIRKDHVQAWFEAKIASEKASATSMLNHGEAALKALEPGTDAKPVDVVSTALPAGSSAVLPTSTGSVLPTRAVLQDNPSSEYPLLSTNGTLQDHP
jgi:hypothetical protein